MNHCRNAGNGTRPIYSRRASSRQNSGPSREETPESRSPAQRAKEPAGVPSPLRRAVPFDSASLTSQESPLPSTPPNPSMLHGETATSPSEPHPVKPTPTYRPSPTPTAAPPSSNATSNPLHSIRSSHPCQPELPTVAPDHPTHHDSTNPQSSPPQSRTVNHPPATAGRRICGSAILAVSAGVGTVGPAPQRSSICSRNTTDIQ